MSRNRSFGLIGTFVPLFGLFLALSGCSNDRGTVTEPSDPDAAEMKDSRQAHLWLSFANVESTYFDADPNPWLTDSWVTESSSFDLDVLNNAKFATQNVVLLVTVPSKVVAIPGWSISINGVPLNRAGFIQTVPSLYGFDGGSHGVYSPSGNGVFYPFPLAPSLDKKSSISVPVVVSSGDIPGFMLHFDVGSTELYNPASHDATVSPPNVEPPQLGACCLPDGSCLELFSSDCELHQGEYMGEATPCTPNPCVQPPQPGACCLADGRCLELLSSDCELQLGVFSGEGSLCTPNPCPQPQPGACCLANGDCLVLLQAGCDLQGGAFRGEGSLCAPNPCPQPQPGACCLLNGSCLVMLQADCELQHGYFLGSGTVCAAGMCSE